MNTESKISISVRRYHRKAEKARGDETEHDRIHENFLKHHKEFLNSEKSRYFKENKGEITKVRNSILYQIFFISQAI